MLPGVHRKAFVFFPLNFVSHMAPIHIRFGFCTNSLSFSLSLTHLSLSLSLSPLSFPLLALSLAQSQAVFFFLSISVTYVVFLHQPPHPPSTRAQHSEHYHESCDILQFQAPPSYFWFCYFYFSPLSPSPSLSLSPCDNFQSKLGIKKQKRGQDNHI
jgi:hypothetical protein